MGQLEEIKVCIVEETYLDDKTYYRPYLKLFYGIYLWGFRLFRYKVEKSIVFDGEYKEAYVMDNFIGSTLFENINDAIDSTTTAIDNWRTCMARNTIKSRKEFEV